MCPVRARADRHSRVRRLNFRLDLRSFWLSGGRDAGGPAASRAGSPRGHGIYRSASLRGDRNPVPVDIGTSDARVNVALALAIESLSRAGPADLDIPDLSPVRMTWCPAGHWSKPMNGPVVGQGGRVQQIGRADAAAAPRPLGRALAARGRAVQFAERRVQRCAVSPSGQKPPGVAVRVKGTFAGTPPAPR
jgi:hypothetical protein